MSKSTIDMVREFHVACDVPLPDAPAIPTGPRGLQNGIQYLHIALESFRQAAKHGDRCGLRLALETEELAELAVAMRDNDLEGALDAQIDRRYIADGTTLELGMAGVFDEGFDRVHAANMAKVVDGKVIKDASGKIRKPDGWKAPDLSDLVR